MKLGGGNTIVENTYIGCFVDYCRDNAEIWKISLFLTRKTPFHSCVGSQFWLDNIYFILWKLRTATSLYIITTHYFL